MSLEYRRLGGGAVGFHHETARISLHVGGPHSRAGEYPWEPETASEPSGFAEPFAIVGPVRSMTIDLPSGATDEVFLVVDAGSGQLGAATCPVLVDSIRVE